MQEICATAVPSPFINFSLLFPPSARLAVKRACRFLTISRSPDFSRKIFTKMQLTYYFL